MYYFASIASASSNVKPDVSQSKATFNNNVGLATVYCRIYCRIFVTLSNQTPRYIRKWIRILFQWIHTLVISKNLFACYESHFKNSILYHNMENKYQYTQLGIKMPRLIRKLKVGFHIHQVRYLINAQQKK